MLDSQVYGELEAIVGSQWASREDAICDSYAAQIFHRPDPGVWISRPAAVVLPGSADECAQIVKVCNKYKIKYKPHSTGFGAHSGPGEEGVLQIDLRRMNRLIEIDEKNMIAVIEPYVSGLELQAEAMKRGLSFNLNTAGPQTSPVAAHTSHQGGGASSVSMGYNGRNLLACEWVTPTGELVQIGSPESGAGWFSADGPGPSMRGIVRGMFGYDGGFGIFTKAAIKLYHWPGPEAISVKGHSYDAELTVPDNFHNYFVFLRDWESLASAFHKFGETEISYFLRKETGIHVARDLAYNLTLDFINHPELRVLADVTQFCCPLMIAGTSEGDLEWKVKVLRQIVDEEGGFMFGGHPETRFDKALWLMTIKAAQYMPLFAGKAGLHVAMGADESIDAVIAQGKAAEEIKKPLIAEGRCFDDGGDGSWASIWEQGTWGHVEALMVFDPRDAASASAKKQFSIECADAVLNKHLGGVGFGLHGGEEILAQYNDATCNFWEITKRIKHTWDPDDLANLTIT